MKEQQSISLDTELIILLKEQSENERIPVSLLVNNMLWTIIEQKKENNHGTKKR